MFDFWKCISACWRDSTASLTSSKKYILAPCFLCWYISSYLSCPFFQVLCSIICERLGLGILLGAYKFSLAGLTTTGNSWLWEISALTAVAINGLSDPRDRKLTFFCLYLNMVLMFENYTKPYRAENCHRLCGSKGTVKQRISQEIMTMHSTI
jgi:hypothetical protein